MSQGLFRLLEACGERAELWGGAFQTGMAIFFRNYNLTAKPLTIVASEPRLIRWLKDDKSVSFLRSLAFVGSLNSFNLAPSLYRWANEGTERGADRPTEGT